MAVTKSVRNFSEKDGVIPLYNKYNFLIVSFNMRII